MRACVGCWGICTRSANVREEATIARKQKLQTSYLNINHGRSNDGKISGGNRSTMPMFRPYGTHIRHEYIILYASMVYMSKIYLIVYIILEYT